MLDDGTPRTDGAGDESPAVDGSASGPVREAFDIPEWVSEVRRLYVEPKTRARLREEGDGARHRRLPGIRPSRRSPVPDAGGTAPGARPPAALEEHVSAERLAAAMGRPATAVTPAVTPVPAVEATDVPSVPESADAQAAPVLTAGPALPGSAPVEGTAAGGELAPAVVGVDEPNSPGSRGRPPTVPPVNLSWHEADSLDLGVPAVDGSDDAIVLLAPSQLLAGSRRRSPQRRGAEDTPPTGEQGERDVLTAPSAADDGRFSPGPGGDPDVAVLTGEPDVEPAIVAPETRSQARAASRAAAARQARVRRVVVVAVVVVVALLVGWLVLQSLAGGSADAATSGAHAVGSTTSAPGATRADPES